MNFTQLKYFETVCSCGSVSKAAEVLHISQPSLSMAIRELEAEFGVFLFKRHHKGVSLTPEGETLLTLGKDILTRVEATTDIMKDLGSGRKILKLGLPPMIGSLFLTQIYKDFNGQYPDITIEISEGGYQNLKQKLRDGFLDIAFMSHDDTLDAEFSSVFLSCLEVVCCVHKDNPMAKLPFVSIKDLENKPLVLFEDSFFQTAKIKELFRREKITPNILLQTSQLSTMYNAIAQDMAVGFMFRPVMERYTDVAAVPLSHKFDVEIGLVYKTNEYSALCVKNFISYMEKSNPFKSAQQECDVVLK